MAWQPDYTTTAELAAYLRIGDDVDDAELALAIAAASRAVDRHTGRQFGTSEPVWRLTSGDVTESQTSDAVVTVPAGATSVTFDYRVSSESGFDLFQFLIDAAVTVTDSGDVALVSSGPHDVSSATTVTFRYSKDVGTNIGDDLAQVDNIVFSGTGFEISEDFQDTTLHVAITDAGDASWTRVQSAAAAPRFYAARHDRRRNRWVVDIDDLMTQPTTVEVDGEAVTAFTLEPLNAAASGRPWTQLVIGPDSAVTPTGAAGEVEVDAEFGWPAVPTPVKQATLLQAARVFARRDAPFGVAGSPETGSEVRLLARVDPDVAVVLGPYIRWWAVA